MSAESNKLLNGLFDSALISHINGVSICVIIGVFPVLAIVFRTNAIKQTAGSSVTHKFPSSEIGIAI
jgi:hypothetical protein